MPMLMSAVETGQVSAVETRHLLPPMGLRTSAEVQRYRGAVQYRASLGAGRSGGSATYPEAALDVTIRNQNQN